MSKVNLVDEALKVVKLREWITAERKKILDDERYHYKPALVHVNAPLALIQVEMKARKQTLDEAEQILRRVIPDGITKPHLGAKRKR